MRVTWATAQNLPWWWLHVEAVGLWYFLEPYAESEIEQACRSFPLLYPRVLRNLSHLRSGAQVAINKEDSKSAHISKEKGQASSRPWELKASPKPPPQSVYWLLCRAPKGVFRSASLPKQNNRTHTYISNLRFWLTWWLLSRQRGRSVSWVKAFRKGERKHSRLWVSLPDFRFLGVYEKILEKVKSGRSELTTVATNI